MPAAGRAMNRKATLFICHTEKAYRSAPVVALSCQHIRSGPFPAASTSARSLRDWR